jgi:hypothetical protein
LSAPDNWNFNSSNPCLHVGGNYNQNQNHGLFYVNYNGTSNANANIGCPTLPFVWLTPLLTNGTGFRTPQGEDKPTGHGLVPSERSEGKIVRLQGGKTPVKRKGNLYEKLISDENLRLALFTVNKTHRWHPGHKPNKTVQRVEANIDGYVRDLREIIDDGFVPHAPNLKRRWDKSAGKWRDISEPRLWPDQYVHHAMIQVLEPVMMRGMDRFCCGSIRGRGIHYGQKAIKKWMKNDVKGTRYCLELDIHHFYDSLQPSVVMDRMKELVKDRRVLDLLERVTKDGILIGAYYSQWCANTTLQPLDQMIRQHDCVKHYLRYMDNFTIFGSNKRKLHRLLLEISAWLGSKGLSVKANWQVYPTAKRMTTALGYRYGHGYTVLRKRNALRLKRRLALCRYKRRHHQRIMPRFAAGLLSRLGQLRHCSSVAFYRFFVMQGLQRFLKEIVRAHARKEQTKWNAIISSAPQNATA